MEGNPMKAWVCPTCGQQIHNVPSGRGHYHDKRWNFDNWVPAEEVEVIPVAELERVEAEQIDLREAVAAEIEPFRREGFLGMSDRLERLLKEEEK